MRGIHVQAGANGPDSKFQRDQGWKISQASIWDFMETNPVKVMM